MDADKLKGLAVVSIAEGKRLGRVEDILFDTARLRLAALQVSGGGQTFVIPFERIKNIGPDAVTVESSEVTEAAGRGGTFGDLADLGRLKRLKVVDEAGTFVGTVHDIDVDPATGQITRITVHKGGVLGLGGTTTTIDAAAVRGVGPEVMTVATDAAPSVPQQPPQ